MGKINIKEDYKDKVLKIWEDYKHLDVFSYPEFEYRKYPILPETVEKNCLMFIGLNPSFTKGSVIQDYNKPIEFYSQNKNVKDIPYFEKMKDVAKYCQTEWTHLDLFFIRETKQKMIEQLSYDRKENKRNGIDFLNAQLDISFEIIKRAEPKLIIVANALASEFFGKKKKSKHKKFDKIWKGFNLSFDNNFNEKTTFDAEIGTYKIELNNKSIPIIFSGMLSGQRALDIGSFERLKWQAKMILDGKKMK